MKLNILSWLIWAIFPALLTGATYQHATKAISSENSANLAAINQIHHDSRVSALVAFMEKHNFAKPYYAKEYIQSADRSHIDYRLLAAISLAESSGCKHYLFNNCFGFGSSRSLMHFASIPEGIRYVSQQLGESKYYAGQSNLDKARTYGPHSNPNYAPTIIRYMNEINSSR